MEGRIALVTGAAGGIGNEVVARLRCEGATVVAADLEPPAPVADPGVTGIALDITDPAGVGIAVREVLAMHGRIDVLVNTAGVYGDMRRTDRIDVASWDRYVKVNLSGAFYVTQAVLPSMVEHRWGRIVNFSSISATAGGYKQAHYAAAKAGLIGLTRSIALEYAPVNITCNAVLPGPIETAKIGMTPPDILEGALERIPVGRLGTPTEVAAAVAFLCHPDAGYVNGVSLPIDGGALLLQFRFARKARY